MKSMRRGCLPVILAGCAVLFLVATLAGRDVGSAPGCWSPEWGDLREGLSYRGILSGNRERCYLVYVPPASDRAQAMPVVFSLHGFGANPDGQRANARWETLASDHGFLVVYPQGSSFPLRWNVGPQARLDGVDDVQFIIDILEELSARRTIDPARVYMSGFSNGGHMTHLLACAQADRIAAVGMVSGLDADPVQGCHPIRPMPVMAFVSPMDRQSLLPAIPTWLTDIVFNVSLEAALPGPESPEVWAAGWAERNGCMQPALTETLASEITAQRYAGCAQSAEVVLVSVAGMGHAWPGGPSLPVLGETTTDIDATLMLWEFFVRHPRTPGG
jgi:polyhydroxybutyrate depolymerase